MLIINVDIFQTVCKRFIEYFCSSCEFEIPVRSRSSQQHSFPNTYYKINRRESLIIVNCFVNFYSSESVSLRFRVQAKLLFSCDVY